MYVPLGVIGWSNDEECWYRIVQKLYKQKSPILRSLFFRNFIGLSCESSWEDSHLHFAPCRDYSSNFRFRTKIRDEKSLNTKQFSAQHNQSTCHVMSTKHEIKMSWRDKFRTAFVVFWSELRCVWQNNILNYSKRRIRANIWKVHVTERPKNSGKRITEGKSSRSALIIVRVTPYRKLSSSPSQVWVTSQVRFNLNRSLFFSLLVFFLFFCFDFCVKKWCTRGTRTPSPS